LTSLQPEEVAIGKAPFVPSEVLGLYQLAGKGLISDVRGSIVVVVGREPILLMMMMMT